MYIARLAKLAIVFTIVPVLVGCTPLFKSQNVTPPPLNPDSASEANFQPLSASPTSCSSPILEPERSALLQEALADSQLQAVKAQLERRGFGIKADEAQAVQLAGGQQVLIPFGENAHLVWTKTNGQTAAVGLIRQGNKTLNISADGQERIVRFLPQGKVQRLLSALRQKSKFQDFEQKLAQKGKRVGKIRVLFDETNQIAILGIANEGDDEKIVHQVWIKVKAGEDDEPEDDAEPAIQATACGQATGEAVPMGTRLHAQMYDAGEGGDLIGSSYDVSEGNDYGPQICTSQWGYEYYCTSRYPMLMVSTSSLTLPQTFLNQQTQASFTIWNGGGGRLTGTINAPAPFSIVSGSSFSLLPGQPQEVVVRFSSTTPGSFSKSISISSNGGNTTVTVTGIAHKVSFSPAQLDFGSGLLVLREQCNNMGVCGLHKVGLPIEKTLTVKNEGTVAVTLTLSTAAPYKIVSVLPTLSPGQSGQVTVRFDPNESGNFTGTVQVGINGGQGSVTSPPLVGMAHKIEIDPAELDFGLVIIGSMMEQKLMIKNHGVTIVTLDIPNTTQNMASPFRIALDSSVTLNPSECKEILVQFDPITLGQFQETISLLIGQTLLSFLVRARVVTPEEFLRIVGTLFIPGNPNLFFDGFAGLEVSLTDFQSLARNLLVGQTQLPSPENLEISQALEELKLWLNNPAFEQKIQELMQRYPAFGAFVNQIQNQLLSLGLSQNYVQVLHIFISLIAEGESSLSNIIWLTSQDDVIRRIAQALAAIVAAAKAHPELQNLVLTLFPLGIQTPIDVGTGFALMVTLGLIPALKTGCPNVDICFENLARRLEQVAATTNNPIAFYNNFKGLLMEVTVAFNISILHGWRLLNFSENYTGVTEIDIIAEKFIPGVGTVVAFIEVKSDKGLSSGDIAKKLINYDNYVKNVGKQKYPGKDPLQTKYVIVFISYEQLSARVVEAALTEFQQDGGTTPTLIIYCASGCNGFGQGVFAFDYANIDGLDAAAIMDNLGFIQIAEGLYKIRDPLAFRLHLAFCLESAAIALTEEKRFQYFCECMRWFYPDPQSPNDVIITRH